MDFQLPTSPFGLTSYITKYVTKSEVRSVGANSVLNLDKVESTASLTSTLRSFIINEICCRRDWGREEASRILLGLAGKKSNVDFLTVSMNSVRLL